MTHRPTQQAVPPASNPARGVSLLALTAAATIASASPVTGPWPVSGPDDTVAVASAPLAGWYAAADSYEDSVEVRDINGTLVKTITKAEITALLPWMDLNGSQDGPDALAFSDSGRLLFIGVHDANSPSDGLGSDAILRYDTQLGILGVFARLEISAADAPWPHNSLAHFKGRLYTGLNGGIRTYRAQMNDTAGVDLGFTAGTPGAMVTGLTIDRTQSHLYAWWDGQLRRSSISSSPLSFASVGPIADVRGLAYGEWYGSPQNAGLYVLQNIASPAGSQVWFVPPAQARSQVAFNPIAYTTTSTEAHDICATAAGEMLIGTDEDAVRITDNADARLPFSAWAADEFAQVVKFGKGLISPSGEPSGWVIDADVQQGWTRFHPATPDGAAWVVLLLLMNDRINNDPAALPLVRDILERHAGLASDAIVPQRTSDGIYHHWIDPLTGAVKPGWDPEYATMSTMKIVLAAARAASFYPADYRVQRAARAIICGVSDWDLYFNASNDAMYLKALANGGPDPFSAAGAFHEGILFAEQAAAYGPPTSQTVYSHWLDRSRWPVAAFIAGRLITGNVAGVHLPAFVSLYPWLLISDYRSSVSWQTQIRYLRMSNMAWTDDNGPRFNTVFSAGTTKSEWGGYNADSLTNHPGDISTFTSLMAFVPGPNGADTAPAVGAYNAYRRGARQTFLSGASILYRRSAVDTAYAPNSAGLPDVALGALGLAELLSPGAVSAVLTGPYPACPVCPSDVNFDGFSDALDYDQFVTWFLAGAIESDFNADGFSDAIDYDGFITAWLAGC